MSPSQSFDDLAREDRLTLIRFVCSFAWADFEVREEERRFIAALVRSLELDPRERAQVKEWVAHPPHPDTLDPLEIPKLHRELFLAAAECVIRVDGELAPEEREMLEVFRHLFEQAR